MNRARTFFPILLIPCLTACAGLKPKPLYTANEKTSVKKDSTYTAPEPTKSAHYAASGLNAHREDMMREIENLLGVPYLYGGTSRRGMDCSGFVQYVFTRSLSHSLPRQVNEMYQLGVSVPIDDLQFGDLVFFSKIEHAGLSHVGIYLDSNQFVHASMSNGVIFSKLDEPYYKSRYVGAKRIPIN